MLDLARRCVFFLSHNEGESSGGATRSYHDFCPLTAAQRPSSRHRAGHPPALSG